MIESLQGRANQLDGFHGSLMCWTQCDICVVQCVSNDVCRVRTVQDMSRTYSVMYDVVFLIPAYVRYYKKRGHTSCTMKSFNIYAGVLLYDQLAMRPLKQ